MNAKSGSAVQSIGRCLAVLALALAAGPGPIGAQTAESPDARTVLRRAKAVYGGLESLRADFEQTIEIPLLSRSRWGRGVWYQKGRGRFRMSFVEPEGDMIVADGTHVWLFYPSTHPGQVIRSGLDGNVTASGMVDLQGRIFEEADEKYEVDPVRPERIDGISTYLVSLRPREPSPYRTVRVWIDPTSYLVRKFEITEENETIRTVLLRHLEPDAPIPDTVFAFVPPAGTDVFER